MTLLGATNESASSSVHEDGIHDGFCSLISQVTKPENICTSETVPEILQEYKFV